MEKWHYAVILSLIMAITVLTWEVDQARADSETTANSAVITGQFRNPESVPKLRSTTNAQREDAARRAAEYRAEVARAAALGNATPPKSTSPPNAKGGAK